MGDELKEFYEGYANVCREMGTEPLPVNEMVALMQMILASEVTGAATAH